MPVFLKVKTNIRELHFSYGRVQIKKNYLHRGLDRETHEKTSLIGPMLQLMEMDHLKEWISKIPGVRINMVHGETSFLGFQNSSAFPRLLNVFVGKVVHEYALPKQILAHGL